MIMAGHAEEEEEEPNAVERYREDHPSPYDRMAGDLMPGSLETHDAYLRTADGVARFLRITPAHTASEPGQPIRRFITISGWVSAVLGTCTVLLLLAAEHPLGRLGWLAVILVAAGAMLLVAGSWQLRRERRHKLFVGEEQDGLGASDASDRDGG